MSIDSYNPESVWKPFGPFSMAVVQGSGKIIHIKGQVSLNKEGDVVGKGDIEKQVETTLKNIQNILADFGGRMEDIFSLTHYVTDINLFMKTSNIRNKYFKAPYPVTTTVEVSSLYNSALMVEITGSAEIPLERFKEPNSMK